MTAPVFFPIPEISLQLPPGSRTSLAELCAAAGVPLRVTGLGARRKIAVARSPVLRCVRMPGTMGDVWIGLPPSSAKAKAESALCVLAYAVFDYAARETVRGIVRTTVGRGRPRRGLPATAAERKRRSRTRRRTAFDRDVGEAAQRA
jgi:hypothetical protein